jgi:DNA-binding LacI/PurR family transcriptional regulator
MRIVSGEWRDRLPPEIELQTLFPGRGRESTSRGTIRQALDVLESEGYIRRTRGSGTYVIWDGQPPRRAAVEATAAIAFVVPYVRDSFVATMLLGVERGAADRGWSVTFKYVENDPNRQAAVLDELVERGITGAIVYPVDSAHDSAIARLIADRFSVVLVDRYLRRTATDYVMSDHFGGALRATQHLVHLGYRRIGFVSWHDPSISMAHRAAAYIQAMSESGLETDPGLICEVESYPEVDTEALRALIHQKPEAIFAANDQIALAIYRLARSMEVRVPHDLALVGFDDLDIAAHLDVPLTTVAQPAFEIGRAAVEALDHRIQQPGADWQRIILPTRLVVRESCGAALRRG